MEDKKIIRAADYLPEPTSLPDDGESFALPTSQRLLLNLFGDTPDYRDSRFEAIWQDFLEASEADTVAYCFKRGVDVLGPLWGDRRPVSGFRDIAVMLKAIEIGLLELADKSGDNQKGGGESDTDKIYAEAEAIIACGFGAIGDHDEYLKSCVAEIKKSDPKKAAALELKLLESIPKDKGIIQRMQELGQIVNQ